MEEKYKQQYEKALRDFNLIKQGFKGSDKEECETFIGGEWKDRNGYYNAVGEIYISNTAAIEIVDTLIEFLEKKLNNNK